MSEIQLTSANGFNVNNIIFSKPQAGGLKEFIYQPNMLMDLRVI